jgi:hypothetical protein
MNKLILFIHFSFKSLSTQALHYRIFKTIEPFPFFTNTFSLKISHMLLISPNVIQMSGKPYMRKAIFVKKKLHEYPHRSIEIRILVLNIFNLDLKLDLSLSRQVFMLNQLNQFFVFNVSSCKTKLL